MTQNVELSPIGAYESSQHFSVCNTKAEIVASLCFSENICGNAAVPPVLISKRIVGGVEAMVNAWPWQVSLKRFGESLNQNYNTIIIVQLIGFMVAFSLQYKCSQ